MHSLIGLIMVVVGFAMLSKKEFGGLIPIIITSIGAGLLNV